MDSMDFPGNSHNVVGDNAKPKIEKNVQKVVVGEVVQRKKPIGRRLRELFFRGEFKDAKRYVVLDVLVPALKNMIVDAGYEGLKRTVYGESVSRRRPELGRPRVSYNSPVDRSYYQPRDPRESRIMLPDQPPRSVPRRRQDVGEIILVSREEAELVVERLTDIIEKFDVASLADLHELVGLPSTYIDNKWGWSVLKYVDIRQVREGYLLDLPPLEPIG